MLKRARAPEWHGTLDMPETISGQFLKKLGLLRRFLVTKGVHGTGIAFYENPKARRRCSETVISPP